MNIDELGREAAVALLTRTVDELDVDGHLRELHARSEPQLARLRSRGRLVAALVAFLLVAVIAGVVAVVLSISGESSSGPSTHIPAKDVVGYVPTAGLPHGFRATAKDQVYQAPQPDSTTFRNVVYLEQPSRGRRVVAIYIMRNPFNGVLADQSPATVPRSTDPLSGLPTLRWTRAPYWELQVMGDVPTGVLARLAAAVSVPADVTASVRSIIPPKAPSGFRTIYSGSLTAGLTRIRTITFSRAYGTRPSVEITSGPSGAALRAFDHLSIVRVRGRDAILDRGHDNVGDVTFSLLFPGRDWDTSIGSTGLSRAELLRIAAGLRPVDDRRWTLAARGARTLGGPRAPLLGPGGHDEATVTIGSYSRASGTLGSAGYTVVLRTFTDSGVPWSCLELHHPDGSWGGRCTDPSTGFAFPTVVGAGDAELITGSLDARTAAVTAMLDDGSEVPVTYYTQTGTAPRFFVVFVGQTDQPVRVTAYDANGRARRRARVSGPSLFLLRGSGSGR